MTEGQPDTVMSAEALNENASTINLCKRVADLLDRHYPGWLWTIEPNARSNVLYLRSLRLSKTYGYVLHITTLQNDPQLKVALRAGGEVLERYGAKRGAYSYDQWRRIHKDFAGDPRPDLSGLSDKQRKRETQRLVDKAARAGLTKQTEGGTVVWMPGTPTDRLSGRWSL